MIIDVANLTIRLNTGLSNGRGLSEELPYIRKNHYFVL